MHIALLLIHESVAAHIEYPVLCSGLQRIDYNSTVSYISYSVGLRAKLIGIETIQD